MNLPVRKARWLHLDDHPGFLIRLPHALIQPVQRWAELTNRR